MQPDDQLIPGKLYTFTGYLPGFPGLDECSVFESPSTALGNSIYLCTLHINDVFVPLSSGIKRLGPTNMMIYYDMKIICPDGQIGYICIWASCIEPAVQR